jgi:multidrug efflux pump subunit AcrA (membrane-fusion protein)
MKAVPFLGGALAWFLAAVALTGCQSRTADHSAAEAETTSFPLFKEGKGIWLSDQTKQQLRLELAEVVERPVGGHLEKTAQVFRAASQERPGGATILLRAEEAKELQPGQTVHLKPARGHDPEITGKLVRLDTGAEAALGQVEALVEFAEAAGRFPVGSFCTARLATRDVKPALVVPAVALLTTAEGSFVYTVNGDRLTRTCVKPGSRRDGVVEIAEGLYAGDMVAVAGVGNLWFVELSALKGGQPCCPVPGKAKAGH